MGEVEKKKIRKTGTAAKEIIIILKELRKIIDITNFPNEARLSDILTPQQIEELRRKTNLEFDNDMRIKLAINNLKFGGLPTTEEQRKELKALGIMSEENIKKLEGKLPKRKRVVGREKKPRSTIEKREKTAPGTLPEKIIKILLGLKSMRIHLDEIRQSDTFERLSARQIDRLIEKTGITDIDSTFKIGQYISNLRQGNIKTDLAQRKVLKALGVFDAEHIKKLEQKDMLSNEVARIIKELTEIEHTEEEIKRELDELEKQKKILEERLGYVGERKNTKLRELNKKGIDVRSR